MRMHRGVFGGEHCDVLLNGEKLTTCIVADDSEGWALCESRDDRGRVIWDPDYVENVRTGFRYGDVALVFDPPEWRERAEAWLREEGP